MSEINVNKTSPDFLSFGLERLRGPKARSVEEEKARLKRASKEFEAFFTYQMLKTMRQTVPESPFSKDSPMSMDAGKETFTDIFDMEIARKMSGGKSESISDLLYKSLERLVQSEYDADEKKTAEIKPLASDKTSFLEIKREVKPIPTGQAPIPLNRSEDAHITLPSQSETDSAQNVSKKPKAP